jgi:rRNA maturation RNase YbeY
VELVDAPKYLLGLERPLESWLSSVANSKGHSLGRMVYIFLNDQEIRNLNKKYLNHDYPTDIITFNYTEGSLASAELYVGHQTVLRQAEELGTAPVEELHRVMVHGLLHCLGFDDNTEEEKQRMRQEEDNSLILRPKKLKIRTL